MARRSGYAIASYVALAVIAAAVVTRIYSEAKASKSSSPAVAKDRGDVPENAPEHCPGVNAADAGHSDACEGCPNRRICASGGAEDARADIAAINLKLADIGKIILVLSGKGGVGKSTVSAQLAWELEGRGKSVGILDIDICGPSIPRMTGTRNAVVRPYSDGWCPVVRTENLLVMSVGFLTPEEDSAVIWRGPKKNGLIKQFLSDVHWGALDYLIVDTPPGTSDEHLSILTYLEGVGIAGAIVVTMPQEISLQDVRKELNFCAQTGLRVLGVVENMTNSLFARGQGNAARAMCETMKVPFAGQLDLSEDLFDACEEGKRVAEGSAASEQLKQILDRCLSQ